MHGLMVLFDMHTKFYHQAIAGIAEEDALKRLNTKANHVAWLAGSLVQERFELAKILGQELKSASEALFADHQGIKDNVKYPSLKTYANDWDKITPILRKALTNATDETLDRVLTFPEMSFPVYEMVAFDMYREANCIGQIALWRRLLGYNPINYM